MCVYLAVIKQVKVTCNILTDAKLRPSEFYRPLLQIINIVKNKNKDKAKVKELIATVKENGGLDFAIKKMETYRKEALQILFEFPKSEYRDALELMLNYVIERKI